MTRKPNRENGNTPPPERGCPPHMTQKEELEWYQTCADRINDAYPQAEAETDRFNSFLHTSEGIFRLKGETSAEGRVKSVHWDGYLLAMEEVLQQAREWFGGK